MAISPLAASMIGGGGGAGDSSLMMAADPALAATLPELQLGQQITQTGTSAAPAYPGQALARALQAGLGAYIQKGALNDLAKAYASVPDAAASALEQGGQANNPAIAMLRSSNPMVRMMGLQMLQKTVPIQSEYQRSGPGQDVTVGPNKVYSNPNPQSPIGKAVADASQLQAGGNPQGAAAVASGVTKETSSPEGVQFPPSPIIPRMNGAGPTPAVAVPPPDPQASAAQMQDARDRLAAQMNAVGAGGSAAPGSASQAPPNTSAGPETMPQQIAAAKQTQAQAEKIGEETGGAVGKSAGDAIAQGGKPAQMALNELNTIQDSLSFGGRGVSSGPWADRVVKLKETLNGLGLDSSWVQNGLPESEVITKLNSQLASAASRQMTARPTQFEFKTWLQNNPGMLTSKEGTMALISIMKQNYQQDVGLGQVAHGITPATNWDGVVSDFYKTHPLISPFTGKPMVGALQDFAGRIDPKAVQMLREQPETAHQFDQHFGAPGLSQFILGGSQ